MKSIRKPVKHAEDALITQCGSILIKKNSSGERPPLSVSDRQMHLCDYSEEWKF